VSLISKNKSAITEAQGNSI